MWAKKNLERQCMMNNHDTVIAPDVSLARLQAENRFLQQRVSDLEHRASYLHTLCSKLSDIMLVVDMEGHYVEIFATHPILPAQLNQPLNQKTLHDTFPAPQADMLLLKIREALAIRQVIPIDYHLATATGTHWFMGFIHPLNPQHVCCILHDFTERKQIETELEQSLACQKATIESTADGVLVVAQDGSIVTFNHRFVELWRLPDDWQTRFMHQERFTLLESQVKDKDGFIRRVAELCDLIEMEGYDLIELQDGRILEGYTTPYRVRNTIAGRVWSFRDVTERRRAEVALQTSQAQLQAIFDNAAVGVVLLDMLGRYIQFNERWADMICVIPEELSQTTYLDVTHPEHREQSWNAMQALVQGKLVVYRMEQRYVRSDGSTFWGDLSLTSIRNDQGIPTALIAIITDITERKRAEAELQRANIKLAHWLNELKHHNRDLTLLNEFSEALQACTTAFEVYQLVARIGQRLFGEHTGTLYIRNPDSGVFEVVASWGRSDSGTAPLDPELCQIFDPHRHQRTNNVYVCQDCQHIAGVPSYPCLCIHLIADQQKMGVLRLSSAQIRLPQIQKRLERLGLMLVEQLTLALANLQLRQQLREQSIRDPLTGLFNRRYMEETVKRELQRAIRYQHPVGVVMLDIDHFKTFNDTWGHDGGDAVLQAVGLFLQEHIRGSDVACRYGGEEFILILPDAPLEDTYHRAHELRTGIKDLQIQHNDRQLPTITISIGVASFPMHGLTIEEVIKVADTALYQAKTRGRDQVVLAQQGQPDDTDA